MTEIDEACFEGQPVSEFFEEITVIKNNGYVVGFSTETRTPIWACYKLKKVDPPPKLTRPKIKFETFSNGEIVVRHKDYTNSGYDRGHMAPSSGIGKCFGKSAQEGTFKTINICPQHPGLNQRCWERFEKQVSDYYTRKMGEVWVVAGPIFLDPCIELESDIRVPQAFFKVVVAIIDEKVEMLGVIMPNERTEASRIIEFVETVDEIEQLAGLNLFEGLDDDIENAAEAKKPPHEDWNAERWVLRPTFAGRERTIRIRECD